MENSEGNFEGKFLMILSVLRSRNTEGPKGEHRLRRRVRNAQTKVKQLTHADALSTGLGKGKVAGELA